MFFQYCQRAKQLRNGRHPGAQHLPGNRQLRLSLEIPFTNMRELAMDMARQGQHVEVLEPPELRAAVKAELKQAQRQSSCTLRMLGAHNLRPSVSGTWLGVTHQKLHVPRQALLPVGGSGQYFHQSANFPPPTHPYFRVNV